MKKCACKYEQEILDLKRIIETQEGMFRAVGMTCQVGVERNFEPECHCAQWTSDPPMENGMYWTREDPSRKPVIYLKDGRFWCPYGRDNASTWHREADRFPGLQRSTEPMEVPG